MRQKYVVVVWLSGFDKYVVDLDEIRPMTAEEKRRMMNFIKIYGGANPEVAPGWLDCAFVPDLSARRYEDYCVKILHHLGGGE